MKKAVWLITSSFFIVLCIVPVSIAKANWWDIFGDPQYGGTITYRMPATGTYLFDPYDSWPGSPWMINMESLFWPNWKTDRKEYAFKTAFYPAEYWQGRLAEKWTINDPSTITVNLRKGVMWHDIPPVNGREFTSADVIYSYHRIMGTGEGYTKPARFWSSRVVNIASISAPDPYTVVFKFKIPSHQNFNLISELSGQNYIVAKEAVNAEGGKLADPLKSVGTGPYMVTDYTPNVSITFTRNPNYWGHDERHPDNTLPYADYIKQLEIADTPTAIAAQRTGKLDFMAELSWQQAASLKQSNPEILQAGVPSNGYSLALRVDMEPFTDIRVRKAMQLSIDLSSIASGYYGGTVNGDPCGLVMELHKDYAFPYAEWPQALKDEYAYNPEEAKNLLTEAGYPNGFETNVVLSSSMDQTIYEAIKSFLMDVGIDMKIRVMDSASTRSFLRAGKHDQMAYSTTAGSVAVPKEALARRYTKDSANYNNVSDMYYDSLIDKYNAALTDDEAKRLSRDACKYALEQHWDVVTFPYLTFNAYQPYIKGYSGEHFLGGTGGKDPGGFWARFWIDASLKKSMGR